MSKKLDFSTARVVIVEPDKDVQRELQGALRARQFQDLVITDSIGELEDLTGSGLIDLVVCDADINSQGFSSFHDVIRQGGHGPNPYLTSIATMASPTEENIKKAIDAGIDNILVKPVSTNAVVDRIAALVTMRRDFSVSTGYIGPDRRLAPRQQVSMPLLKVPNTLREKANGTYDEGRILREIDKVNAEVTLQRTTQNAVLINAIVRQIVPHYESGAVDDSVLIHFHHLNRTAQDIVRRNRDTDKDVTELCDAMIPVLQKLMADHRAPDMDNLRLLQNLGSAIYMAYGTDDKIGDISGSIAQSIKGAKRFSS